MAAEVITPSGNGAHPMLVAFVVRIDYHNITRADLARSSDSKNIQIITLPSATEIALAERLPSYMIPAIFFAVDSIPVNSSGKTDRKKLQSIGADFTMQQLADMQGDGAQEKRLPSTEVESELQQIFARVLNIDPVSIGVDDSFFRLGGDSITAMQVSSLARSTIGNISSADIMRKKNYLATGSIASLSAEQSLFRSYTRHTRGERSTSRPQPYSDAVLPPGAETPSTIRPELLATLTWNHTTGILESFIGDYRVKTFNTSLAVYQKPDREPLAAADLERHRQLLQPPSCKGPGSGIQS